MKSSQAILIIALALACGAAQAQGYRWVDKDGKTRYGDTPPPGVKATPMNPPASGPAPAPSPAAGSKDAKKVPAGPADQEQAFRERQLKAKEAADKATKDQADAATRKENCARAQSGLRNLMSGQRIASTNAAGERMFLDDSERPAKITEAEKVVAEWCK